MGTDRANDVAHACVQADGGGDDHQYHGGQNTDVGKADGVLLHAVEHAGDADEVASLIVEALAALQKFQHGDADGHEQAVSADDDQQNGQKEQRDGRGDVLDQNGDGIACGQRQRADHHQRPLHLRLFLTDAAAAQQLDGLGEGHLPQVGQQEQGEDGAEHQQGERDDTGLH